MAIVADFLSRIPQTLEISDRVLGEHKQMVDAIVERDRERAIKLMDTHLDFVDVKFKSSFEKIAGQKKIHKEGKAAPQSKVIRT
jgi:DNA-binding FadR family transcriptional regulator